MAAHGTGRDTSKPTRAEVDSVTNASHVPSTDSFTPTPFARVRFLFAAVVMLAVTVFLVILAWKTANPVVISAVQVEVADDVIIGQVMDAGENRIRVTRVFKGAIQEGREIRVFNLPDTALIADQEYILALSPVRRDFQVTVLNNRGVAPPEVLIYPVTSESIDHVKRLVRNPSPLNVQ
ncbi:MAG: hypothetical protein NT069_06780 [Planctomycetota bacterium]|nr:hypothetical protein [Planctomycetota bacterium]